ncbi:MAG: tetratricopeptide repeat protein [Clostridiaceae bacterium]
MSIEIKFKEKLATLLFVTLKKDRIKAIFDEDIENEIYIPIKSSDLIENSKVLDENKIPLSYFIEGMFYVLGADEDFKYNSIYKDLLNKLESSNPFIKGRVFKLIDAKQYEEAYILLKGLCSVEKNKDNYNKIIFLLENLRKLDGDYKEEEIKMLDSAKEISNYALPYLYEAIIKKDDKDYESAYNLINFYISEGGEVTPEVSELKDNLKIYKDYENAISLIDESPKEALAILIPLIDVLGDDPSLLYYVGVASRNVGAYEKAIYYLNEALALDSDMIQVVNEIGINYASLGDYDTAIKYLKKAFEVTRSIEICTNIVMCYINKKDIKNAKLHLEIAEKLDKDDEIVKQIKQVLK